MKRLFYFLLPLLAFVGCMEGDVDIPFEGEPIPIKISTSITRATDTAFEVGDKVGVYVVNQPKNLESTGNHVDNMCFTYSDIWTPDTEIYWRDSATNANFYVYYPYGQPVDVSAYVFEVNADQSKEEDYWNSDFIWGKAIGVTPSETAVPIDMGHIFSNMLVYVQAGEGFTNEMLEAATIDVKINNIKTTANINLANGTTTASGETTSVTPYDTGECYRALIVPQTVDDDSELITVSVDGIDYVLTKGFTFKANKQYTFTVTLNNDNLNNQNCGITLSINDWDVEAGDFGGTMTHKLAEISVVAEAEDYQAAKLTWSEVAGATYYKIKVGDDVVAKIEGATDTVVENLTTANNYVFTVTAYAANGMELAVGVTEEIQIFTLTNRPEPVITLAEGVLTMVNGELHDAETTANNLHVYGILLEAEIYFYKDGATEPAHVAKGSYLDSYPTANLTLSIDEKKMKNNVVGAFTAWKWDGAAETTQTAPEFEAGKWTVKYKAGYYAVINASYTRGDRIVFTAPSDVLQTMVYREADSDLTFMSGSSYKLNAVAAIDNGTEYIKELFRQYGTDWYNYDWNGLRSVNAQLETVTLTWNEIPEADKVVIEYLGETVEVATGLPSHTVSGLKTSPVEFTVTAYQGDKALVSETVSTPVYTLPETASGTFSAIYHPETKDWTIKGEDFNTTQYATWNCSFNLYEKGSETPVFENPITKNGKNDIFTYISFVCRGNGWVQASKNTFVGFHVGDGIWDQGKKFTGLKGNTEYEVRFELSVWPYIYDPNGVETNLEKPQWDLVKIMMTDDKATQHGAIKLAGTTSFTTGEGPAEFEVSATAEGYQGAKISWNALGGAIGYEVYVGETKVADAGADATSVVVTDLTDAQKYTFTVKALGVDITADTQETEIYTLCNWTEPVFNLNQLENGSYQFIVSNLVNLNYAYGGMTTDGGKSTIEIYKDEELVYTLVNSTPAGTLAAWAGFGRWALAAQDNRRDWTWHDADGNVVSINAQGDSGEVNNVPATFFAPGKYAIKYKIGYVVNKNGRWAKGNNESDVVANREDGANCVFFGPRESMPSPNVLYIDNSKSTVAIFTKEGTYSKVIEI